MAVIDFDVTFNYATSKLTFLDTTDWAGQSISTSNVNGDFKVVTPNGLTYYNNESYLSVTGTAQAGATSNITLAVGASSTNDFYKNLNILITSGTGVGQVGKITSYNGTTKVAIVETAWSVVPDNTSVYGMNFADIYIAADLDNQVPISVPLTSGLKPYNGNYTITYTVYNSDTEEYYTLVKTFELCHVSPTVTITHTVDCISPLFVSVDTTNYIVNAVTPTIDRTNSLSYPAGTPLYATPTITTGATISTGVFYTGVQQTTVSSNLTYTVDDGVYVYDTVIGGKSTDVDCDSRLCDIFCCIITLYNKMNRVEGKNAVTYNEYLMDFTQCMSLVALARESWNCGKEDVVNGIITKIRDIAGCTEGCGCTGDTPQQVTGLGATLSLTEVTSGGYPVEITPTIVGNTTIYEASLNAAFVAKVGNSYNTIVATDTPDYLTIASSGTTTKTYTVTFDPANLSVSKSELCFKVLIDYTDYLGTFITVDNVEIQPTTGSNFVSPTVESDVAAANSAAFLNATATFNIFDFMDTPNATFKPFTSFQTISQYTSVTEPTLSTDPPSNGVITSTVFNQDTGEFQVIFYSTGAQGALLNIDLRDGGYKFYLNVFIKE